MSGRSQPVRPPKPSTKPNAPPPSPPPGGGAAFSWDERFEALELRVSELEDELRTVRSSVPPRYEPWI